MSMVESLREFLGWQTISAVFFILIIYNFCKRNSRIDKCLQKIEGPPDLPILGNSLSFLVPNHDLLPLFKSWHEKYGSMFKVWVGNQPFVVFCAAAETERILSSTVHIEKSQEYNLLHMWLGQGLLTAKPNKWRKRRKELTPAFHFKILEEFTHVFNDQANLFVKVLKSHADDEKPFDMFPYVTRCALDIICETAMGKKLNCQINQEQNIDYVKAVYGYGDLLVKKFTRPWLQVDLIWKLTGGAEKERKYIKTLHGFTEKVIRERKQERLQNSQKINDFSKSEEDDGLSIKKRIAFLDLLLDMADSGNPLSDEEIREETDTFMFEGHDTTSANLIFTILALSTNLEHQKLVQEELDEIFGQDKQRDIKSADITRMKYLECCIKESLRIYPSVPFYFRNLAEDLVLGDKTIPIGTSVSISAYLLHRDPKVFSDPEAFRPQRFFPENCIGRSPFAYVPFSAGARNCIGQKFALLEEKIVLAKLFMNFNFQAIDKREDVKLVPDIILRPVNGVFVKISPRFKNRM